MDLKAYAENLNKGQPDYRVLAPGTGKKLKKIPNIRAVICDVYGTILTCKGISLGGAGKEKRIPEAFKRTITEFGFTPYLKEMGSNIRKEEFLKQMYFDEIKKVHKRKKAKGIRYPEVQIELVWQSILKELIKQGYKLGKENINNLSFKIAYFHKFVSEKNIFYKNAFRTLKRLKQKKILLGLVSNAQFYTPIMLGKEIRKASKGKRSFYDIFDRNLVSFSYLLGESKPGKKIFNKVINNLRKKGINKTNIIYIGNDAFEDIKTAKNLGLKTALFAGDKNSLKLNAKVKPDVVITGWEQLSEIV